MNWSKCGGGSAKTLRLATPSFVLVAIEGVAATIPPDDRETEARSSYLEVGQFPTPFVFRTDTRPVPLAIFLQLPFGSLLTSV